MVNTRPRRSPRSLFCGLVVLAMVPVAGWIGLGSASAAPQPLMTPDQAMARALAFCNEIGQPASGPGSARFPVPPPFRLAWSHYLPCWIVQFPGESVQIVDGTGVVCNFSDGRDGDGIGNGPAGQAISQDDAVARAQAALQASGCVDPLIPQPPRLAGEAQIARGEPIQACNHQWSVGWLRSEAGIPYRDQGVGAILQAESGRVLAFGLNYFTPPPASTAVVMPSDTAGSLAVAQLQGAGLGGWLLENVTLNVVRPNNVWLSGPFSTVHGDYAEADYADTAWVCQFGDGSPEPYPRKFFVFIDAATGETVGGDHLQWHGAHEASYRGESATEAADRILIGARSVRVYAPERGRRGGWRSVGVIDSRHNHRLLALLRGANARSSIAGVGVSSARLDVTAADGKSHTLYYAPEVKWLGGDGAACEPAPALASWLKKLLGAREPGRGRTPAIPGKGHADNRAVAGRRL